MSDSKRPPNEKSARRTNWTEGTWITLNDNQGWSFPPPAAVPGYQMWAKDASKDIFRRIMALPTIEPARLYASVQGLPVDPAGAMATLQSVLALYQGGYTIASEFLKKNYDITYADCEILLPFNYQVEDYLDPNSNLHKATPSQLAMFNASVIATGVNISQELGDLLRQAGINPAG